MNGNSKELYKRLFRIMIRIRLCEESLVEPILQGQIKCPVHLCSGQEAIAAGVCETLSTSDYVWGNHRSHGHYIAQGGSLAALIAEIFGKETGCSKGRGGSMHVCDPEKGMIGAAPIVGGTVSLAVGSALASKIRKENRITISFFGDGATGEGVLFESLNFAALYRLPIIFVCENNLYSTHMPIARCRPNVDIYKIAEPFGIYSIKVDGNDVLKVYEETKKCIELVSSGNGPVFMECLTYRLRGHVGPDDNIQGHHHDIRPASEVEEWRKKDPISMFEQYLVNNHIVTAQEVKSILQEEARQVESAHIFAANSPFPDPNNVNQYVFK